MCSYFSGHSYLVDHADLCHLYGDENRKNVNVQAEYDRQV